MRATGKFSEVVMPEPAMPDPYRASEVVWLKWMREVGKVDATTIVVGHSSGAVAAMRLLETTPLAGVVLVSACWTDLGEESERIAGYYSRPWLWDDIKAHAGWIVQFHSVDDPFIPPAEARHVAKKTGSEYFEHTHSSHFFEPFDELIDVLVEKAGGART